MCDAPLDCEECASASPETIQTLLARHISEGLSWNPRFREVVQATAVMNPEDKAGL
jgi:hypothetical protein